MIGLFAIRNIIKQLNNANLSKVNDFFLKQKINILLGAYTKTYQDRPPPITFYRSRALKEKPQNRQDISYPPMDLSPLGRANRDKESMFYASGNPAATLFELGLAAGDTFALSTWTSHSDLVLLDIGYTASSFKKLDSDRACPVIVPAEKKLLLEHTQKNQIIHEFFAKVFTDTNIPENNVHRLSSLIAKGFCQLCKSRGIEGGIAYPATKIKGNGENIALPPSYADNHLKLKEVQWCRIDHVNESSLEYICTPLNSSTSFSENGDIYWD